MENGESAPLDPSRLHMPCPLQPTLRCSRGDVHGHTYMLPISVPSCHECSLMHDAACEVNFACLC